MTGAGRKRFRVYGRVQGIGYRWFVQETAERNSLTGWVRNLEDGSVEAEAQGGAESLKLFESALRTGNRVAWIRDITAEDVPAVRNETGFTIKI